jgi:hypothetical protein
MTPKEDEQKPLMEPVIVLDVFATGVIIETVNEAETRLTAWVEHEEERRIVARLVLPDSAARALIRDLRKTLAKGGH